MKSSMYMSTCATGPSCNSKGGLSSGAGFQGGTNMTGGSQESWADVRSYRWCGGTSLQGSLQVNCAFVRSVAVSEVALNVGGNVLSSPW